MGVRDTSALRKKPLKILVFGDSSAGKTHFGLFSQQPVLVFDMESGTDMFEGRAKFSVWEDDTGCKTQSFAELRKCIDFLGTPEGKKFKTFVIDPVTIVWDVLQQQRQDYKELNRKNAKQEDNETDLSDFNARDWAIVKKMYKTIMTELVSLPQNVIMCAREKEITIMRGNEPVRTGEFTYEGEKGTKYYADFTIRLQQDSKTGKRWAIIHKDRASIFNVGDRIDNPTFAIFDSIVNKMANAKESVKGLNAGDAENIFAKEETLETLVADAVKLAREIKSSHPDRIPEIKEVLAKAHPSGNPHEIKELDVAKQLMVDLEALEAKVNNPEEDKEKE
jgi:hypothetical protein